MKKADLLIEVERLRQWVFCPEHGPHCGGDRCCCTDRHQPELAADRTNPPVPR